MQILANPNLFMRIARKVIPWAWALTILCLGAGLYLGLLDSPADYQQGETVRIMYVHVPAAWMALFVYVMMAVASAMALVFRHPLADAAAKAAAPMGAAFCFLSLATGSIWGKPMWGTWWVWDARLTSMFVLMLLYLGYLAVWKAFDDPHRAAGLARVVALVGVINIPIVKFSVDWWNTLHQPASVVKMGGPSIDSSMLWPLLLMALGYTFFFIALHLVAIGNEITARKIRTARLKAIGAH
ncbi:heme ABC transporter permease [Aestuariivirga sp.]|uniref:heme ABC transporter permease n=1 Tax=Aestuariivirga sp. TaxID=2650926 RepID=UPI0039E26CB8